MTLTPDQIKRLHFEDGLIEESSPDGLDDRALRVQLRQVLSTDDAPVIADAVMAQIGGDSLPVGDAIREASGKPPALWSGVAAAIGAPEEILGGLLRESLVAEAESGATEPVTNVPVAVGRSSWPWFVLTGVAAAAAAALVVLILQSPEQVVAPVAKVLEPVVAPVAKVAKAVVPAVTAELDRPGITIIESLESETASVLQILQFDDDAPTIIFIDDEPGD